MARTAHVPFAASGWANNVEEIRHYMKTNSDFYFQTTAELARFLEEE